MVWSGMGWTVETLDETVDGELADLPEDMQARFVRITELIEAVDLPNVREPHVRHVRGSRRRTVKSRSPLRERRS